MLEKNKGKQSIKNKLTTLGYKIPMELANKIELRWGGPYEPSAILFPSHKVCLKETFQWGESMSLILVIKGTRG